MINCIGNYQTVTLIFIKQPNSGNVIIHRLKTVIQRKKEEIEPCMM